MVMSTVSIGSTLFEPIHLEKSNLLVDAEIL